jgi:hypothetical protein
MRKKPTLLALFSTLVLASGFGCSDEEGSTVSDQPNTAGTPSTSGGSGGNPLQPRAGSSSTAGSTGEIPMDACQGLPIDLSDDEPQGGAPAGGAPADGASSGAGGAPTAAAGAASEAAGAPAGGASSDVGGAPGDQMQQATAGAGGADEACSGVSVEAEAVPVDLFIMMDRSQSMGFTIDGSNVTRWEALRDAVESFALDAGAAEIRAGIGFFSLSGAGDDALDCDADNYAEPAVPIGLLSDVGSELVAAMDDITPAGLTPTVPALEGAISYARSWASENPERATLVVLVSDGYPTQCSNAPEAISAAARAGYESDEHIRTFVIGVGDVARFNLDNYARAGGTVKAFLTDADDITSSFVDALNNISNRDLACEYQIPEPPAGMKLDTDEVQVIYTPASGDPEEVPSVGSLLDCASSKNGGWYYDIPGDPSKIKVCPCTCARFQAGHVDVRLGCKPRLGIR